MLLTPASQQMNVDVDVVVDVVVVVDAVVVVDVDVVIDVVVVVDGDVEAVVKLLLKSHISNR